VVLQTGPPVPQSGTAGHDGPGAGQPGPSSSRACLRVKRLGCGGWSTLPYFRILTARATTRIPTTTEIVSSAIIKSFAHGFIAETSVGLNAIEVLKDRCR
jgi:hypothetical protein